MLASVTNILSGGSKKNRSIFIGNIWTTPPILGGGGPFVSGYCLGSGRGSIYLDPRIDQVWGDQFYRDRPFALYMNGQLRAALRQLRSANFYFGSPSFRVLIGYFICMGLH